MPESLMDKQSESGMPWASHASWQAVSPATLPHGPETIGNSRSRNQILSEKLRNGHKAKHKLLNRAMAQIKSERNLLENEFIRIIS
jgi:hypothetical protein